MGQSGRVSDGEKTLWILNHYAVTPDLPGGTRHVDLARELVKLGWRVTILASAFHHVFRRHVKLAPGQRWRVEEVDGVDVVWIRTTPYRGNDWRRTWSMVDYTVRAWWTGRLLPRRIPEVGRPDVVLGSSVHLLAVVAAWRLARHYRARFVMEVRDLWPQTLVDMGQLSEASLMTRLLRGLEAFLYRRAARIVTLLPRVEDYIASRGIPREKVVWVPNGVDLSRFPTPSPSPQADGPFTVMYPGAHGEANALGTVIEAAALLQDQAAEVRFVFVGDGPEKEWLMEKARSLGLRNVEFRDPVRKAETTDTLHEAHVFVFHLQRAPVFEYGVSSNKLFDYMAAERPVVFAVQAGNNPVDEAGCGITIAPEDPAALADAVPPPRTPLGRGEGRHGAAGKVIRRGAPRDPPPRRAAFPCPRRGIIRAQ